MVTHPDMETNGNNHLYSQITRKRKHITPRRVVQGSTRVSEEAEGAKGKCGQSPDYGFCRKALTRQGEEV